MDSKNDVFLGFNKQLQREIIKFKRPIVSGNTKKLMIRFGGQGWAIDAFIQG